jgi:parvulin-like peptidyl-prolyl isomerase
MNQNRIVFKIIIAVSLVGVFLTACKPGENTPNPSVPAATAEKETALFVGTSTPIPPTPTSQPLAALVNEEGITLQEYHAELERYQMAVERELTAEDEKLVLNNLISEVLLAQAAVENGFVLDDAAVQERLDDLIAARGGQAGFDNWLARYHYDPDRFNATLARSIRAAWMRDQIAASVPEKTEQVHIQQIRVNDAQEAEIVLGRLKGGADFGAVAFEYDPQTGGDLGWTPRGYLFDKNLEDAAFSLEPGQFSEIINTPSGYHILYLVERDTEHPLAPDARQQMQMKAVEDWLEKRFQESEIQIIVF